MNDQQKQTLATACFLPTTRIIYGNTTLDVCRVGLLSSGEELFEVSLLSGEWLWGYEIARLCVGEQPDSDSFYEAHILTLTDTKVLVCVARSKRGPSPNWEPKETADA
jgi:hypothetical protein